MRYIVPLLIAPLICVLQDWNVRAQSRNNLGSQKPIVVNPDSIIPAAPLMMSEDSTLVTPCSGFNMPVYKVKEGMDAKILYTPIDKSFNFNMPVIGQDTTCWKDKNRAVD